MFKLLRNLKEKGDLKTLFFHSSWAITLTSGLSYGFGMLRDKIFATTFGATRTLDVYNAAFTIPDTIQQLFILTALSAAFVPIFTRQHDQKKSLGHAYAHQVMTYGVFMIAFVGILTAIFLPHLTPFVVKGFEGADLEQYILLTRIMLLSPIIFAISLTYGQILISMKEFLWWGLSPMLYNAGIVMGALVFYPYFGLVGLVFGTLSGALFHLFIRLIVLKRKKYDFQTVLDFRFTSEIKETIKLALPKMLQYGMFSLMLIQFTNIATDLPEGRVAIYNYARNFQSLPVSLLGIAFATAMYPTLSHDAGKGMYDKFIRDFRKNRFKSLFYTTLAAIALALLGRYAIQFVLGGGEFGGDDVTLLWHVLIVYCFSIPLESMLHIYHRAFYSLKNTLIPSLMHAFTIMVMIGLAMFLSSRIGIFAIPTAFGAGLVMHIAVLSIVFPILYKRRRVAFELSSKKE